MFTPYEHQEEFAKRNPKKYLVGFDTSLGKTYTSLSWVVKNDLRDILVITLKTLQDQWRDEVEEHAPGRNIQVVSKEFFRDKWPKDKHINALIIDEAHWVASKTSGLHKKVVRYLAKHKVEYRLLLTATPILASGSMNIYALATVLGYKLSLPKWREVFQHQVPIYIAGGRKIMDWQDKTDPATEARLLKYIWKIGTMIKKEDVFDIPPQVTRLHWIEYSDELREKIKEEVDGEVEAIVLWTKIHRAEQSVKMAHVTDLMKKYDRIMLVVKYTSDLEIYKELLAGYENLYVMSGKTKDRGDLLKEVIDKPKYIFLVNSAISEGYELPHTEAVIFITLDFSFKNFYQMPGRAFRVNKPSPTDIHIVVTRGGSDQNVYESLKDMKSFSATMFIKKKERREQSRS